jgi:hypothetical protein
MRRFFMKGPFVKLALLILPRGGQAQGAYRVSTMERMLVLETPASVRMVRPEPSVVHGTWKSLAGAVIEWAVPE